MAVFEVVSGGDRRSLIKRFERKSKHDAVSELVDIHLAHCTRIEKLEAEAQALREEVAALRQDKDRLDAIEGNCWDVRYSSSPNADAGDSSIGIEIVGHYQGAPHVRVLGESYTENLRAAIDQAMTAEAYPPERPQYDDHGRPLRAAKA